eukprot:PhF_6_TR36311/c0_g1_i10/m.53080
MFMNSSAMVLIVLLMIASSLAEENQTTSTDVNTTSDISSPILATSSIPTNAVVLESVAPSSSALYANDTPGQDTAGPTSGPTSTLNGVPTESFVPSSSISSAPLPTSSTVPVVVGETKENGDRDVVTSLPTRMSTPSPLPSLAPTTTEMITAQSSFPTSPVTEIPTTSPTNSPKVPAQAPKVTEPTSTEQQQQQQPSNSTSAPNMSPARANRNRSYSHNQSALNEICGDCNEPYSKFPYCHTTGTRHPHPKHYGEGGVPTRTEDNRQQPQQPPSRGSSQRPPSPPKPNEYNNNNNYNDNNNYQPARQSGDGPPRPPSQRGGGPTPSTGPIQPRWGTSLRERDETQPEVVIGRKPPLPGRIPQRWGQERYAQGPSSGVPSSPPRGRAPSYPQPVPNSSGVVRTLDIHETPMRGGGDGDGYYEASNEDPIIAAAAQRSQKGLLTRERVPDPNCPVHSVPRFRDGDNHPMNNNNNMIVSEDQTGPPNWLLQRGYPANGSNPNPNNNNTNSNTNPNSSANTRNPNSSNARGPTNNNNPTGNSQNPLQMRWAGGAPEAMKSTPLNESAYQEVENPRNNNNDGFNNPQQQSSNNFMMGNTNSMQPPPTPSSNTVMMVDVPPGTTAAQSAPMMVMPNSSSLWKEWTGPDGIVYVLHEPTGKIKQKTNNGYYEDVILEEGAGHQGPEYNATDPVLNMNTKTIRNVDYYPSYARSMSGAFSSNEVVLPTVPRGQFSPTRTSAAVSLSAPKVAPPVYTGKRLHTITVGMADPNDPSNPNHTMVSLQDSSRVRFDLGEGGNSMFSSGGGGYAHDAPMGPPVSSVLRQRWEYVRNVLTQGRYFVKHSLRTGTTSYRFVYLSSTGNLICWVPTSMVPANAGPRYFGPETRTIPTAAVVQVLPAPLTPVAGFLSQVNPRLDAQCCFGFFCVNDVTLLLESNTREEASYWVDAWNFFLFYSVPGGSNAE